MGLLSSKKSLIGLALMVVGTLALLPGLLPNAGGGVSGLVLAAGALVLTAGTWLVGTSGGGRPV